MVRTWGNSESAEGNTRERNFSEGDLLKFCLRGESP